MRRRLLPPLAAFLAVCFPGLGHLFLGRTGRAVVWHATIVGGALGLTVLYDVEPMEVTTAVGEIVAAIPTELLVTLGLLVLLSAIDALVIGKRMIAEADRATATAAAIRRRTAEDGETGTAPVEAIVGSEGGTERVECPTCGRETDAEIDFCHWCTDPLPWADDG